MIPEPAILCPSCGTAQPPGAGGELRACTGCGESFRPPRRVYGADHGAKTQARRRSQGELVTLGGRLTREEAETLLDLVDAKRSAMDVIDREDQRIASVLDRLDARLRAALGVPAPDGEAAGAGEEDKAA